MDVCLNTYTRYKQQQKEFTTWLIDAAKKCGESIGKLNAARKKKGYQLSLHDHLRLAVAVAETGPVPRRKLDILDQVISLRKSVGKWLQALPRTGDDKTLHDEQHQYFLDILQTVKDILLPACREPTAATGSTPPRSLDNMFSALSTPNDESLNIADWAAKSMAASGPAPSAQTPQTAQTQPQSRKPKTEEHVLYDMQAQHDDVLFAWLCFFMDFNQVRDTVRRVWSMYNRGEISLVNASVITNTAVEMLRHSCRTQFEAMKGLPHTPDEAFVCRWIFAHLGWDPDAPDTWTTEQHKLANWSCYSSSYILWERYCETDPIRPHLTGYNKGQEAEGDQFLRSLDKPVKQLGKAMMKSNDDWGMWIYGQLHNMSLIGTSLLGPGVDWVTSGWKDIDYKNGTSGLPLNGQNLHKGFSDLNGMADSYVIRVRDYFQYRRHIRGAKDDWHKDNDPQVLKLIKYANQHIKRDSVWLDTLARCKQNPDKFNIMQKPFFLLKNHPWLCGMMGYWMQESYRLFDYSFAGSYMSILGRAHMYNATLIQGLADKWDDKEFLIQIQGEERFFLTRRPTSSEDVLVRFQLAIGMSMQALAKNRRKGGKRGLIPQSSIDPGTRIKPRHHSVHSIFLRHWHSSHLNDRYNLSVDNLSEIVSCILKTHPSFEILELIKVGLEDDDQMLNFDMINMHARCQRYLDGLWNHYAGKLEHIKQGMLSGGEAPPMPSDVEDGIEHCFEYMFPWDHQSALNSVITHLATVPKKHPKRRSTTSTHRRTSRYSCSYAVP
ncbi:Uu.00g109220.m01.CDS01 [Anthostomella pinea]|uniref:Uu.00g109220.m01.CDS01 n=1 Tax=Anthostomella pinea TaxID=933095 RepID=A0AAI8VEP9_9PEZI|nr:Uu.00g109220.m01.CDS01 [Anthostomella pinea]